MALTHVATSAWVPGTGNVTPTLPTGTVAGDLVVITLHSKYEDALMQTDLTDFFTAGGPWTDLGAVANTGRPTGNDNGNTRTRVYYKVWNADSVMPTMDPTPNNVSTVKATTYRSATGAYLIDGVVVADNTVGTPLVLAAGSTLGLTSGDILHVDMCLNGDAPVFSTITITATGTTPGSPQSNGTSSSTALGTDMRYQSVRYHVSAGTATVNIQVSTALTGTTTNAVGTGSLMRIREQPAATPKTGSETTGISVSETSSVVVQNTATDTASLSASERASRAIVGQENRLLNASFETTNDWVVEQGTATLEVVDTDAYDGSKALRVTATSSGTLRVSSPDVPINPVVYPNLAGASVIRKISGTSTAHSLGYLVTLSGGGTAAGSTNFTPTANWQRVTFNPTTSQTWAAARVRFTATVTSGDVLEIDAVQLNEVNGFTVPAFDPTTGLPPTANKSGSDTSAISVAETKSLDSSSTGTDTSAIAVSESTALAVSSSATDASGIGVSETSSILKTSTTTDTSSVAASESTSLIISTTLSAAETNSLSVSDVAALDKQIPAADSGSISVSDVSAISSPTSASDTAVLGTTETSGVQSTVAASESNSLSVSESTSLVVSTNVSANESNSLAVAESKTLGGSSTSVESNNLAVSDVSAIVSSVPAADIGSIAVSETSSASATGTLSESNALAVSENTSLVITTAKTAAESNSLAVTDVSALNKQIPTTDTSSIAVDDDSLVELTSSRTDTNALSVTESTSIAVSVSGSESTALSVAESNIVLNSPPGTDLAGIGVDDQSSLVISGLFIKSSTDTAAIGTTEDRSIAGSRSATDSASIAVADASSTFKFVDVDGDDGGSIAVSETATISATVTAFDGTAISVNDVQSTQSALSRTDTAAISASDIAARAIAVESDDEASVGVADVSSVGVTIARTDTASIAASEQQVFGPVAFSSSDNVSLSVSDTGTPGSSLPGSDSAVVSVSEQSSIQVFGTIAKTASDAASIAVSSTTQTQANLTATDTSGLSVSSVIEFAGIALATDDQSAIGVSEESVVSVERNAFDGIVLGVEESTESTHTDAKFELESSDELAITVREYGRKKIPGVAQEVFFESGGHTVQRVTTTTDPGKSVESSSKQIDNFALNSRNGIIVESGD